MKHNQIPDESQLQFSYFPVVAVVMYDSVLLCCPPVAGSNTATDLRQHTKG